MLPVETLTALPEKLTAGTTVKLSITLSSYPADDGWALTLYLAGAKLASWTGAPIGKSFAFTLDAATTGTLTPGVYRWELRPSKAGEVYAPEFGSIEVLRNIASALAGDFQSHDERTLAVIEAALEGRLTADLESYQIHGRSVVKIPVLELAKLRAEYAARVELKRGGKLGPTVRMSFTGAASET